MFAAEGLEVAVSTDHEFRADYAPAIERLGLLPWVRSIRDTWFIVHVTSRTGTLDPVYSSGSRPFAFTNPIWLDVDGNGRFDPPMVR